MTRLNRHGWRHERQPEYVIRAAVAACIIALAVLAALWLSRS